MVEALRRGMPTPEAIRVALEKFMAGGTALS
jgi:hypothetical protein